MEALARKIAGIVSDQTSASPEDREVFEFAMKLVINTAVDVGVIFSLAYILGVLRPVALAYVLVALLKYFAGGAHASKMVNCLVTGTAIYVCIGFGARALAGMAEHGSWAAFLVIASLALLAFALYAPAVPPQKPLKSVRQGKYLRRGAMIALGGVFLLGVVWLSHPFTDPEFFWAGCISLVWQSLILLPGSQRLFDRLERYMF